MSKYLLAIMLELSLAGPSLINSGGLIYDIFDFQ